ncbi:histidine phosphatase family protein [Flavobacteriaceae bacterium F08102]|nr:histidine phosphatase family protein [Flavobacteriaceae bacterium F08102]
MKKLVLLCLFLSYSFSGVAQALETSTYYLIRHAEKDRSDKTEKDPHLAVHGKERALRWAEIFKNLPLDAVYSTNFKRTIETGTPTAKAKNVSIQLYHPTHIDMVQFLAETKGKNILVVGHSNTTASFANNLIGNEIYKDIDDANNGNLYVVTFRGNTIEHVLLHME